MKSSERGMEVYIRQTLPETYRLVLRYGEGSWHRPAFPFRRSDEKAEENHHHKRFTLNFAIPF